MMLELPGVSKADRPRVESFGKVLLQTGHAGGLLRRVHNEACPRWIMFKEFD